MIIFIMDLSADYFLNKLIDCLVCKKLENSKKCQLQVSIAKLSQYLVQPIVQSSELLEMCINNLNNQKEKQQMFTWLKQLCIYIYIYIYIYHLTNLSLHSPRVKVIIINLHYVQFWSWCFPMRSD